MKRRDPQAETSALVLFAGLIPLAAVLFAALLLVARPIGARPLTAHPLTAHPLAQRPLPASPDSAPLEWPSPTRECRPWAYNWWPASAVDKENLLRELRLYSDAGLGGIHIIPIYGVKRAESRSIEYLSPQWMEMLDFTVAEADRLGLGVDMTTGTGWCFGGPNIPEELGCLLLDGRPTGQAVKRSAPGGVGLMLNPISGDAMRRYLQRFTAAFASYKGRRPRSMYHDSYEYRSEWSPDFADEFAKRRGYRVDPHMPALDDERVRCDYKETVSDLMIEKVFPQWIEWCRGRGILTRNQAHGSPANILDLYALADIPETEMFHNDRDLLVSKFASSAAHVAGRKLVAAETGTWLSEHFTETLEGLKRLVDDLFLAGVNHVIYHGCCYSPDDAAWPGWLFYASTEMNPRNAVWRDVPALNVYIARCQSVLQSGRPDNDLLLYWPIHDLWSTDKGLLTPCTVHNRDWLYGQPFGATAKHLWTRGYSFDYVSDRQLAHLSPGRCRAVVVPPTMRMPAETMSALERLAEQGITIIFEDKLPTEVPGLAPSKKLAAQSDRFLIGDLETMLEKSGIIRESLTDSGALFIRRAYEIGRHYFIANITDKPIEGWYKLGTPAKAIILMDPLTGRTGVGRMRAGTFYLQLQPGHSIILRTFSDRDIPGEPWPCGSPSGAVKEIKGPWQVKFIQGGPAIPSSFRAEKLSSWTHQGGEAERFAGAALYATTFDSPAGKGPWVLALGEVCHSARVRLNGKDLGTLIMHPYSMTVDGLRPKSNRLEIEVTNLSANRIRDLDRRKIEWRIFLDINFVNIDYKPFDASDWPVRDSGLLGPVTLQRLNAE